MHTPTPWHVGMRQADRIVYDAQGWAIANATVYHAKGDGEPLENAKFIVEACNAHDALVAACERVLRSIEWSTTEDRMTAEEQAATLRNALSIASR